jgi:hypothetical protein
LGRIGYHAGVPIALIAGGIGWWKLWSKRWAPSKDEEDTKRLALLKTAREDFEPYLRTNSELEEIVSRADAEQYIQRLNKALSYATLTLSLGRIQAWNWGKIHAEKEDLVLFLRRHEDRYRNYQRSGLSNELALHLADSEK